MTEPPFSRKKMGFAQTARNYALLYWHLLLKNRWVFVRQALRGWMDVGSLWPTGGALRRKTVRMGIGDALDINLMILHGVGCGEFLYEVLKYVRRNRIRLKTLIVIEKNKAFIAQASRLLGLMRSTESFEAQVVIECLDALYTRSYLASNGFPVADVVIGTLPYTNMPDRLGAWVEMYAEITKTFVLYSYTKLFKRPSAREATDTLMALLRRNFSCVSVSDLVWWNIPPARVISAKQRAPQMSQASCRRFPGA